MLCSVAYEGAFSPAWQAPRPGKSWLGCYLGRRAVIEAVLEEASKITTREVRRVHA